MKNKIAIVIIIIIFILVSVDIMFRKLIIKKTDYSAIIYHSEMFGIDAGTEYIYYIYKKKNKGYYYIKTTASIKFDGVDGEKFVKYGTIKDRQDLEKIKKSIAMDKTKALNRYINYNYIQNGVKIKCETIEELANQLFQN